MEQRLTVKFQKLLGTSIFPPGVFYEGKRFERSDLTTQSRRGTLFALLTLSGPNELEASVFGQAIFDSLEEDYFGDLETPPLAALEKAAFSAHRRLSDMALAARLSPGLDFNLLLAVAWGKVLYLCRLGAGAVYLLRDGKVSEVFLGEESNVVTGSGFVYDGDGLILGSPDFKKFFPATAVDSSLPKLEEKMFELSAQARLAALVLKFQLVSVPDEAEAINFVRPERSWLAKAFWPKALARLGSIFKKEPRPAALPAAPTTTGTATHRRAQFLGKMNMRRFRPALLFIILISLFVVSVFLTVRKSQALKLTRITEQTLNQADLDFTAATDLVDLNNPEAQKILSQSLNSLAQLEKLGVTNRRLSEYRQKIQALLSKVSKVVALLEPKLLYDFELSQKGIGQRATNLTGSDGNLFLADSRSAAVWRLKIDDPAPAEEIGQGQLKNPLKLAAFGERLAVLEAAGISFFDLKKRSLEVGTLSFEAKEITDLANYNGNLYFLNVAKNQIQRASATAAGYGKIVNWLKEEANFEKARSLAVNGAIFVQREGGQILKFEGGKKVDFSLSGLSEFRLDETFIYTGTGLSDLYAVEFKRLKIYKFSDLGVYLKTYDLSGTKIGSINSFYVNPSSQKLYLLSGSKVYEIGP